VRSPIRVGTRRSRLARVQTGLVVDRLARRVPDHRFETVPIETSGDRDRRAGSSPDFTDAIDRALARGEIDLAVHSAKDLPSELDRRFVLAACPPRADPRDCLIVAADLDPLHLSSGARVGSSSLRRRAQLLRWRPDLTVVEIRGNVDTRLAMVRSGSVDAVIVAVAGVARLGRASEVGRVLPTRTFLPAPAQGALAVVARAADRNLIQVAGRVDDPPSHACVVAERAFSASLGGDCRVPLGALARSRSGLLTLTGEVLSVDGRSRLRARRSGVTRRAEELGRALGGELRRAGAMRLRPVRRG
jgi:hydroxymethylbilane synthase